MRFELIDQVLECSPERIVAVKNVSAAEEYLADHFPTFPVLPGVLMIEAMVQAARRLLTERDQAFARHVLGHVKALKYATFVSPGETLRLDVRLLKEAEPGVFTFQATGWIDRPTAAGPPDPSAARTASPQAVSGRFTMRPLRAAGGPAGGPTP